MPCSVIAMFSNNIIDFELRNLERCLYYKKSPQINTIFKYCVNLGATYSFNVEINQAIQLKNPHNSISPFFVFNNII